MLAEWFAGQNDGHTTSAAPVPGVMTYDHDGPLTPHAWPGGEKCECVEILYCRSGRLCLRYKDGRLLNLGPQDVFLLTDAGELAEADCVFGQFSGCLVAADTAVMQESFAAFCALLGEIPLDTRRAAALMQRCGGTLLITEKAWRTAFFEALAALPPARVGAYCALKSLELLYLICGRRTEEESAEAGTGLYFDRYQAARLRQVHDHMIAHPEQRLTVAELAQQFRLSPTFLKAAFRRLYGEPIHHYLQRYRLQKAAQLLRGSELPLSDIAAAVGYSSVSQFSAAFRVLHGTTPARYRRGTPEEEKTK